MNRISFLNRGYAFKGLLAVSNVLWCTDDANLIKDINETLYIKLKLTCFYKDAIM